MKCAYTKLWHDVFLILLFLGDSIVYSIRYRLKYSTTILCMWNSEHSQAIFMWKYNIICIGCPQESYPENHKNGTCESKDPEILKM
jgi:hypothetical protein